MRFDLGPSLATAREAALAEVDRISRVRAEALGGATPAHAAKREEAAGAMADRAAIPSSYPLLAAEIGITAPSLVEVAQIVSARAADWRASLARIEAARIAAKARIRAAASHSAIREIVRHHQDFEGVQT